MLNRLTGWILILAVLIANYSTLFIYADFKINQKYIASNLCENRNKPWLHCNGHCYLMKKLRQAAKKEKAAEKESQKNLIQETISPAVTTIKFHSALIQTINTPYNLAVPLKLHQQLFRPPRIA